MGILGLYDALAICSALFFAIVVIFEHKNDCKGTIKLRAKQIYLLCMLEAKANGKFIFHLL
jgi:hypothetical protein